jgi:hypothetical protein
MEALGEVSPALQPHVITLALNGGDRETDERIRAMDDAGRPAAHLIREHVRIASGAAVTGERKTILPFEGAGGGDWYEEHFKVIAQLLPDQETLRAIEEAMDNIRQSKELHAGTVLAVQVEGIRGISVVAGKNPDARKAATAALLRVLARPEAPADRTLSTHWHALRVLKEIGPDAKDALPALKKMKFDPRPEVREAVGLALQAMGPGE